jgi:hypothetical protein
MSLQILAFLLIVLPGLGQTVADSGTPPWLSGVLLAATAAGMILSILIS